MNEFKDIAPKAFASSQKMAGDIWSRTKGDKVIWAIVILLTMMSILVICAAEANQPSYAGDYYRKALEYDRTFGEAWLALADTKQGWGVLSGA